jgi:hypothetical protein
MKPFLVVAALFAALALPADAASPPAKQQIAKLKQQVARLQRDNRLWARVHAEALAVDAALRRRIGLGDACPFTTPNLSTPPGSTAGAVFHGNGKIWVGMWPSNIVVKAPEPDGTIDAKFGWWRGVPGTFTIDGRRLDAPAPPLSASVPDGYGEQGFQATGIVFPAEGCWEVTGRIGDASLTFVTLVLKA